MGEQSVKGVFAPRAVLVSSGDPVEAALLPGTSAGGARRRRSPADRASRGKPVTTSDESAALSAAGPHRDGRVRPALGIRGRVRMRASSRVPGAPSGRHRPLLHDRQPSGEPSDCGVVSAVFEITAADGPLAWRSAATLSTLRPPGPATASLARHGRTPSRRRVAASVDAGTVGSRRRWTSAPSGRRVTRSAGPVGLGPHRDPTPGAASDGDPHVPGTACRVPRAGCRRGISADGKPTPPWTSRRRGAHGESRTLASDRRSGGPWRVLSRERSRR